MDRESLKRHLSARRSLAEIGALEGKHPSTVGYWLNAHGLVANGRQKYAPRGGLARAELEPLVDSGGSLTEIAAELDRSVATVRR